MGGGEREVLKSNFNALGPGYVYTYIRTHKYIYTYMYTQCGLYMCVCVCARVRALLCLGAQLWLTLCDSRTIASQAPLSMGILQARILEWVSMPYSRGSSHPGFEPRSPTLQADSLPSGPPGKPIYTYIHTYMSHCAECRILVLQLGVNCACYSGNVEP